MKFYVTSVLLGLTNHLSSFISLIIFFFQLLIFGLKIRQIFFQTGYFSIHINTILAWHWFWKDILLILGYIGWAIADDPLRGD